jgi:integrase
VVEEFGGMLCHCTHAWTVVDGVERYALRGAQAAEVKPIKFHGLRHTCATLLLQAGEPVASERLGHAKVSMTLDVYAHATEDLQQAAAVKIGALLHG